MTDDEIIERGWKVFNAMQDRADIVGEALAGEFFRDELQAMTRSDQVRFFAQYLARVENFLNPSLPAFFMEDVHVDPKVSGKDLMEQYPQGNRHERRAARAMARKRGKR